MPSGHPNDDRAQQGPRGLRKYVILTSRAGSAYLAFTAIARLPLSMVPLAVLSAVTAATGSLATAGIASGAAAIGEGMSAPIYGTLGDRFGQRRILIPVAIAQVVVLVSFGLSIWHLSAVWVVVASGIAGATMPQISAMSRARWMSLLPRSSLTIAFAFEGILDELNFLVGPILVGVVAVAFGPTVTLAVPGVIGVVFVLAFALHPTERATANREAAAIASGRDEPRSQTSSAPSGPAPSAPISSDADIPQPPLLVTTGTTPILGPSHRTRQRAGRALFALVLLSMLSMGFFFGGTQTALTAVARDRGVDGLGAVLYGIMAIGSVVCTVFMVYVPARVPLGVRWLVAGAGLLLGALGIYLALDKLPALIAMLVFAGCFQGPMLLTVFDGVARVTSANARGATMALMTSCNVLGVAGGAAVAGTLGDRGGATAAMAVVGCAVLVLLLVGLAVWKLPAPDETPPASTASASIPPTSE